MRKTTLVLLVMTVSFLGLACETTGPKTKQGAVVGGLLGAAAGGIIGHQSGHGLEGAGIGAATGAIAGGLLGSAQDQKALETNPNHLPITKIVEMASQGVPSSVIIEEIQRTKSVYNLDSETIAYLKSNNVSDRVIDYMLSTSAK